MSRPDAWPGATTSATATATSPTAEPTPACGRSGRRSGFAAGIGIAEERLPTFLHPDAWWRKPGRAARALTDWLERLPLPVAVFAGNDYIGVKLANACAQLGLTVPDQVALVGVDNEEVLCEFANPPLSSVPCDTERMGYAAARLLDRLMEGGETAPAQHIVIPPLPLVVRASSNRFTTSDAAVLAALRRIHHGGGLDLGVPEAVAATGLSRRALELRFRAEMGRSIHDEIIRARLLCACQLLTTTADPIRAVATASGFASAPRFHQVFRAHLGVPPSEYRRRHRPEPRAGGRGKRDRTAKTPRRQGTAGQPTEETRDRSRCARLRPSRLSPWRLGVLAVLSAFHIAYFPNASSGIGLAVISVTAQRWVTSPVVYSTSAGRPGRAARAMGMVSLSSPPADRPRA